VPHACLSTGGSRRAEASGTAAGFLPGTWQADFWGKLDQQFREMGRRDLALNLDLIVKRGELWRAQYVVERLELAQVAGSVERLLLIGRRPGDHGRRRKAYEDRDHR
jgi:hypothetical protein